MSSKDAPLWRRERLGLSMIAASLAVIVALCVFLLNTLIDERRQQVREQGVELLRVLGALSLSELAPASNPASVLRSLSLRGERGDLLYAVISLPDGRPHAEAAVPGIVAPPWSPPSEPAGWFGERELPESPN
ncbi:MAG: hypothetical protein AAFU65_12120, partial [Pseudomonadota bacterium]